jgi:hypothetical protein
VRLDQNDAVIQLKNHPIQMIANASFGLMITILRLTLALSETQRMCGISVSPEGVRCIASIGSPMKVKREVS